jgi:uncharacterized protein (DUF2141 family)
MTTKIKITNISLLFSFWFLFFGLNQAQGQATIKICGGEPNVGQILLAVYDTKETFPKEEKFFKTYTIQVDENGCAILTPTDLPPGKYAFAAAYDKNKNGQMDKTMIGIPKEPYGFSNNARSSLSPPKFEDALVEVKSDSVIEFEVDL